MNGSAFRCGARVLALGALLVAGALRSAPVVDAQARGARPSDVSPPAYDQAIDEALAAYDAGRWAEALASFRRANEIFPNARALRGIGMAAFEVGDYTVAIEALDAALANARRPLTADQIAHARGLIGRANAYVGYFTVSARPGATLVVDGQRATPRGDWPNDEGLLLLTIGEHTLSLMSESGAVIGTARVRARGGEREALTFVATTPTTVVTTTTTNGANEQPSSASATRDGGSDTPGWVTFGVSAALASIGSAMLIVGTVDADTVTNAPRGTDWTLLAGAAERAPLLSGIGTALAIAGGIGMAVGLVLVFTTPRGSVTVSPTALGLQVSGSW